MQHICKVVLVSCCIALAGCATPPATTIDTTRDFTTPAMGKAGIYFYRWSTGLIGAAADTDIVIDGKKAADIDNGEFFYLEVEGGTHSVIMIKSLLQDVPRDFVFVSGRNYFFRGSTSMGDDLVWPITADDEIVDAQHHIEEKYTRVYE